MTLKAFLDGKDGFDLFLTGLATSFGKEKQLQCIAACHTAWIHV